MTILTNLQPGDPELGVSARLTRNGKGLSIYVDLEDESPRKQIRNEMKPDSGARFTVNGLFIRSGSRFIKIPYNDILFLEASGSYTLVHTKDKKYTLTRNLARICTNLGNPPFLRVHRSYAVNLMNIESFSETAIYYSGKEVPVSSPFRKTLLNYFSCL